MRKVSTYDQLKLALEDEAQPGDVVEVQPGVYYATSPRITVRRSGTPEKPIIIRGVMKDGQRPAIDGTRVNTNRGLIVFPVESHDVIVENLEVRHAVGMRHEYNPSVSAATTEAAARATPGLGQGGTSASGRADLRRQRGRDVLRGRQHHRPQLLQPPQRGRLVRHARMRTTS